MILRPVLRGILSPILRRSLRENDDVVQPTVFRSSNGLLIKTSDNKILAVK